MNINYSVVPGSKIICVSVCDLPYDMRRVLRMQFKEFINLVEDEQLQSARAGSSSEVQRSIEPLARGHFSNSIEAPSAAA